MKPKISQVVKQVALDFCPTDSWLKTRKKAKDLKCENCGIMHADAEGEIALATVVGRVNAHICEKCGKDFIQRGAEDIKSKRDKYNNEKENLIESILQFNSRYVRSGAHWSSYNLEDKKLDELQEIHDALKLEDDKLKLIEELIKKEYIETPTEQYLIDQYNIHEYKGLRHHLEIEKYFRNCGLDLFETGQGFYEDEVEILVKIGNKFYDVTVYANIESSKQDRGDRLYWVESIRDVSYTETTKPEEKAKTYSDTELMDWLENNLAVFSRFGENDNSVREFIIKHIGKE